MDGRRVFFGEADYNIPKRCEECGGVMVYKGVGEYKCEDCKHVMYDDYGKVRLFVEKHPGALTSDVSAHTGVSQHNIRQMLKEERLEISANSSTFLRCEICGASIRSGRLCHKCEMDYHRAIEAEERAMRGPKEMSGIAKVQHVDDGEKRFTRSR